uniref:DUF6712 family protein n=1 Tax=Alistipes sp. TaxID=1872444 RepID=UPI0040567F91
MKNLITNEQVISLAFGDGEYLSAEVVSDADIALATDKYIIPVVGEKLYEEMLSGSQKSLLNDYVAPALAMAVRTLIQPSLNVRTGQTGLQISSSMRADTSIKSAMQLLQKSLRLRRQALLRRLSNYLRNHASEFPNYHAGNDVLQNCRIDGGYVQMR